MKDDISLISKNRTSKLEKYYFIYLAMRIENAFKDDALFCFFTAPRSFSWDLEILALRNRRGRDGSKSL